MLRFTSAPRFVSRTFARSFNSSVSNVTYENNNESQEYNKPTITIGELINFTNQLQTIYKSAPEKINRILLETNDDKLNTVFEYYSKNGKSEPIKTILDNMPLAGTVQAYMYLIDAHLKKSELKEAISILKELPSKDISSELPYQLVVYHCGQNKNFEEIINVLKIMEDNGVKVSYDTYLKIGDVENDVAKN